MLAKLRALFLTLLLLGAAGYASYWMAQQPFGFGLLTDLSVYGETYAQNWDDFGFERAGGIPLLWLLGDTVKERVAYSHHPPMGWWPPYFGRALFDKEAIGYKLFPAFASFLAFAALFLLTLRQAGSAAAILFCALLWTTPAFLLYAVLPGLEPFLLLSTVGLLLLYERWRLRPSRWSKFALFVAIVLGGQVGWAFYFVFPGIFFAEWLRPRGARHFRWVLPLALVAVASIALTLAHVLIASGDPEWVFEDFAETFRNTVLKAEPKDPGAGMSRAALEPSFFATLSSMWPRHQGPAGPVVWLLGLLVVCLDPRRRPELISRVALALFFVGALSLLLFNGRSNTHGYYWFLSAASYALFGMQILRSLLQTMEGQRSFLARAALIVGVVALIGASALVSVETEFKASFGLSGGTQADLAQAIEQITTPEDAVLLLSDPETPVILVAKRRFLSYVTEPEQLQQVLKARAEGRFPYRRIFAYLSLKPGRFDLESWQAFFRAEAALGRARRYPVSDIELWVL